MNIRIANSTDLAVLVQFQKAMARESEDITLNEKTLTAGLARVLSDNTVGTYYVAEIDSQSIACLMVTKEWSDWRNGHALWIQSVYVRPENRRQGVYRRMYKYLQDLACADPHTVGIRLYVEKENHNARKTYRELGMDEDHYIVCEWLKAPL